MIPTIGILIALYIITRMLQLIIDETKKTSIVTLLFAGITLFAAIYTIYSLITSGSQLSKFFPQ